MRDATGRVPRRAGSKTNFSAAASAASSKPLPTFGRASARVTFPASSMSSKRTTSASVPTRSASAGYGACSKWLSFGGVSTAGVGGGAGSSLGGGATAAPGTPVVPRWASAGCAKVSWASDASPAIRAWDHQRVV